MPFRLLTVSTRVRGIFDKDLPMPFRFIMKFLVCEDGLPRPMNFNFLQMENLVFFLSWGCKGWIYKSILKQLRAFLKLCLWSIGDWSFLWIKWMEKTSSSLSFSASCSYLFLARSLMIFCCSLNLDLIGFPFAVSNQPYKLQFVQQNHHHSHDACYYCLYMSWNRSLF